MGQSWDSETIVLEPTLESDDQYGCVGPSVVKSNGYYYMAYTSPGKEEVFSEDMQICVARSTSSNGTYEKWNGSGWGGGAQAILSYSGADPNAHGYSGPSLLIKDGNIYVYYNFEDNSDEGIFLSTANASDTNWPSSLVSQGKVISKPFELGASADIKYVESNDTFIAISTVNSFSSDARVEVWTSQDGYNFSLSDYPTDDIRNKCYHVSISGDVSGHLLSSDQNFIAYPYFAGIAGDRKLYFNSIDLCYTDYLMDFNQDCKVDLQDYAAFADEWNSPWFETNIMNFNNDNAIDIFDLQELCFEWLIDAAI
jgi:hypothetical protein